MKIPILTNPSIPISLKLTAHGYINITSTSNNTKVWRLKIFYRKGIRAFPTDSIPHSKLLSLFSEDLLGLINWKSI